MRLVCSPNSLDNGCEFCQSNRYGVPSHSTRSEPPPTLPPLRLPDSLDDLFFPPPGIPQVGIPGPDSDRITVVPSDDADSSQHSPKMPGEYSLIQYKITFFENNFLHLGSKNFKLPGPDSKVPHLTIDTSGHTNDMEFSFSDAAIKAFASCSTSSTDPDSTMEQQLDDSIMEHLELAVKKLQSGSVSPRARDSLYKLLSVLASPDTPVSSSRTTSTCESLCSW